MSDPFKPSRQQIDSFLSNLHTHSEFCLAKYKKAERYRDTHAVRQQNGAKFDLSCSLSDFRKYGPGVYLYFRFVKMLSIMFLLLFLISVPSLASNYSGKGLEIYGNVDSASLRIMKLSLANQHYYEWSRLTPEEHVNVSINRRIAVCTDLLISIVFFLFMVYWRVESDRVVREFILDTVLPSYHTIFLPELPASYTEEKIITHFERFGRVAQVSSIKDISKTLRMVTKFGELVDRFKILQAVNSEDQQEELYELYVQIIGQYNSLKKEYRELEEHPYLSAFVSFQSAKTRNMVLEMYSEENKLFLDRIQFEGQKLKVQKCNMEPINIIWENIHIKSLKDFQKGIVMTVIMVVLLFTSLSVLFFIKVNSNTGFVIDQLANYTFEEVLARKDQNHVTDTFCYRLSYQAYKPEYEQICKASFSRFTSHLAWTVGFSCVIVFVNYLIGIVIRALATIRRYRTNTDKNRFLIINYFAFYFINTALLTLMVQGQVANMSFKTMINKIFHLESKLVQVTIYNQFNRRWYIDIGRQILINFMISLIVCPLFGVLIAYGWQRYRRVSAKFAKIQRQMNLILVDKQMDFNIYYGLSLNIVFFTMFYSPGLPILYLLAALAMFSIYFSSKFIFIRFSCQPSRFDHTLNEVISTLLPLALLVHQFTSLSFFTVNEIFPKLIEYPQFFKSLMYRLSEGFLFEILAILILVYYVMRRKLDRLFGKLFDDSPEIYGRRMSDKEKAFELLCTNGNFLYSYKFQDNPNYRDAFYAMTVLDLLERKYKQQLSDTPSRIIQNKIPKVKSCEYLDQPVDTHRMMNV